jgi:hypothetical protein
MEVLLGQLVLFLEHVWLVPLPFATTRVSLGGSSGAWQVLAGEGDGSNSEQQLGRGSATSAPTTSSRVGTRSGIAPSVAPWEMLRLHVAMSCSRALLCWVGCLHAHCGTIATTSCSYVVCTVEQGCLLLLWVGMVYIIRTTHVRLSYTQVRITHTQ